MAFSNRNQFPTNISCLIPIIITLIAASFIGACGGGGGGGGGSDTTDTGLLDPTMSAADLTLEQALSIDVEDRRPVLLSNLGPPDAFSKTVDEVEGQLLVSEEWSYIAMGVRLDLVDGEIAFVTSIDTTPDDVAIYPRFYDPAEFDLLMDKAAALEVLTEQTLTEFDLGEAGIADGVMVMGDQILLGFANGKLVYVETYARIPDSLGELQNLFVDEPVEPAQTIVAGLPQPPVSRTNAGIDTLDTPLDPYQKATLVESLLPPQAQLVIGFFRLFRAHDSRNRVYREADRLQRDYADYLAKLDKKATELAGTCRLSTLDRQSNVATLVKVRARLGVEQQAVNLLTEAEKKEARSRFIRNVRKEIISALQSSGFGARVLTKIRESANIDQTIADLQNVIDGVLDPGSIQQKIAERFEKLGIIGQVLGGPLGERFRYHIARIQKSIPILGSAQDAALEIQGVLIDAQTTIQDIEDAFAQDTAILSPAQFINALVELKSVHSDPAVDALATALAKELEPGYARNLAISEGVLDPTQLGTMRERVRGQILQARNDVLKEKAKEACGRPAGEPVRTELLAGSGLAPRSASQIRASYEEAGFTGHLGPDGYPMAVCRAMPIDFESLHEDINTALEEGELLDLSTIAVCRTTYDEDGDGVDGMAWGGTDCDDADDQQFPGNAEICDGQDNNCDGNADEGLSVDIDGDGHYTKSSCASPNDDCNDSDSSVYPGAVEIESDGIDQDCDGKDAVQEYKQYHVFKRSGIGYRKMWGGFAEYRTGYDYFYAYVLPSEVSGVIDYWSNFDEATTSACESLNPPICPCPPYPDIWTQGNIELIGSFDTIEELDPYRCDAPSYMPYYFICNEWTVDSNPKYWDNINAICGG